jgi:hypothetical protein
VTFGKCSVNILDAAITSAGNLLIELQQNHSTTTVELVDLTEILTFFFKEIWDITYNRCLLLLYTY